MRCSKPVRRSRIALAGTLALVLGALTSCSLFDTSKQFDCPVVGMPRETATLTRFREGPGRDLTDVVYEASIADVKLACTYTSKGVNIDLGVVLAADRGPANTARTATIPYYIAVVDPERNILAKEVFTKALTFQQNVSRAVDMDETQEVIPLPKGKSAERYGIVIGMQLTAEEVEYNRNKVLR
jgi:hypothetical protein